ncbi:ATP-dependent DNA helicase RecG [Candidatus Peregrinibacteria bacterium]|nr:ATP-dependent DNA helicase RecG [Candidatus Peregrinibacteria bacterium]
MNLTSPLKGVLRTTKDHLEALEKMGIRTVGDLLNYLPRAHEDLSEMQTITAAPLEQKVTIRGTVTNLKMAFTRTRKRIVTASFTDAEGATAQAVWFNQPHIMRMIKDGDEVVMTGKLIESGYKLQFQSPSFERGGERALVHAGRLVPVYPQHDIINTKWLREKMVLVKEALDLISETLPESLIREEKLLSRKDAIRSLHFPEKPEDVLKARNRMAFEEMFAVQRQALERKKEWQGSTQERLRTPMEVELIKALFASLKFTPTNSQKIAIYEILRDMEKDVPMSRLLEGDVGSGKTLVAVAVMANVLSHGGQCALMVPTEVLARQHAATITRLLLNFYSYLQSNEWKVESAKRKEKENFPLSIFNFPLPSVALLTGSTPKAEAEELRQGMAAGTVDVAIGTHALIEDSVRFKDLRLVIVDEQHRFGVLQRQRLRDKGSPHFLSMTATPIPRTLALTAFGDHDLSVLLEKPGKRQPIHTKVVSPKDRTIVERFIDAQIGEGRQAFVICPLITESDELLEVKNVTAEAQRLKIEFPRRRIAMLHGKLRPEEKQEIMRAFRARESDILVSTSVIEVGIDVPNATIILIEGAERFGLAQLHQLRGRVGRGDAKSHCFLFTTTQSQAQSPRLKAMEEHDSGFMLAEIDLKLRGPGELYGLRQSGIPELQIGSLLNPELVVRARRAAEKMLGIKAGSLS